MPQDTAQTWRKVGTLRHKHSHEGPEPEFPKQDLPGDQGFSNSKLLPLPKVPGALRNELITLLAGACSTAGMAMLFFQLHLEEPSKLFATLSWASQRLAHIHNPLAGFLGCTLGFVILMTYSFLGVAEKKGSAGVLFLCNAGFALLGASLDASALEILLLLLPFITVTVLTALHLIFAFCLNI